MQRDHDYVSGASLDSIPTEILLTIAEYTMSDAHAILFKSEPLHRQFASLSPPLTPTSEASTDLSDTTSEASTASSDTTDDTQSMSDVSDFQDGASTSNEFTTAWDEHSLGVTGLLSLSLINRHLRPIAQEVLHRSPILRSDGPWNESAPIFLLARTLLSSPQLAGRINTLRLDVPREWDDELVPSATTSALVTQGQDFIEGVDWMNPVGKERWKCRLRRLRPMPFFGLVLSHSRNLRKFSIGAGSEKQVELNGDFLGEIFWSTHLLKSMTDTKYHLTMEQLIFCPELAGLKYVRSGTTGPIHLPPFVGLKTLTSLDLSFDDWPEEGVEDEKPKLPNIKRLRLNCRLDRLRPDNAVSRFVLFVRYRSISALLASFPKLKVLELYAGPEYTEQMLAEATHDQYCALFLKRYEGLVYHLRAAKSTLRRLELPRGWWTAPRPMSNRFFGASTGSIADFSVFSQLQTLITHPTAILSKSVQRTWTADSMTTLPSSIEDIVVYGAHDGLWPWIEKILEGEGSYFAEVKSIELRTEDPVHPDMRLLTLEDLKGSQVKKRRKNKLRKAFLELDIRPFKTLDFGIVWTPEDLKSSQVQVWKKLQTSKIRVFGDV